MQAGRPVGHIKNLRRVVTVLAVLVGLNACHKRSDLKGGVSELEKAFPTAAAPAGTVPAAAPAAGDANAYVSAALSAARAQDYAAGVMALEEVQRMNGAKGFTANQLMTIELAKRAMIAELVVRADRGDPKAKADLAALERTHSQ